MAYKIDAAQCTACGSCEDDCPVGAPKMKGDAWFINPDKCTECAGVAGGPKCVSVCPADCISLAA